MGLPTTGPYKIKPYRCRDCGVEREIGTNHWGDCYPFCNLCGHITSWECLEEIPIGFAKPVPWQRVRLGDIADVKIERKKILENIKDKQLCKRCGD